MIELALIIFLADPNYTQDVKPLFHDRCSKCHDSMGNKNWQIYENAYQYRYSIRDKVISGEMPMGEKLFQGEKEIIINWVNSGAKK